MASNFMSRLLPSTSDEESAHPTRQNTLGSDTDQDDMAIDEENLGGHFENQDLDALLAEAAGSEISEVSTRPADHGRGQPTPPRAGPSRITPKWMQQNKMRGRAARQEQDDEVPASLMLEEHREVSPVLGRKQRRGTGETQYELPPPVPGPSTNTTRAQWESTKRQQQLHDHRPAPVAATGRGGRGPPRLSIAADPKERALWKWAQVDNLDAFLAQVYNYYEQKGIWSIVLRQVLLLL
jgi:autophagy-related protein 9